MTTPSTLLATPPRRATAAVLVAALAMIGVTATSASAEVRGTFDLTPMAGDNSITALNGGATTVTTTLTCPQTYNGDEVQAVGFVSEPGQEQVATDTEAYVQYIGSKVTGSGITVDGEVLNPGLAILSSWYRPDVSTSGLSGIIAAGTSKSLGIFCLDTVTYKAVPGSDEKAIVAFGTLSISEDGETWSFAQAAAPKTTTATALTASAIGLDVSLTATVTPTPTSGTVEFFDGGTSVGTATPAAGVASLTLAGVAAGDHSYTATYSGDDSYEASTSTAQELTVSAPVVPPVTTTITVQVPTASAGSLALTGADSADLGEATQQGDGSFAAAGPLGTVTVTDTRADKQPWSLTGRANDFTGPAPLPASALGWEPAAQGTLPDGVGLGGDVTAGAPGLSDSQPLAQLPAASATAGTATTTVDAALSFLAPAGQAAGSYTTTLVLTLV